MTDQGKLLKELSHHSPESELIALTQRLIAIPSHSEAPGGEKKVVDMLAAYFAAEKIDYELQPVDDARANIIAHLPGSGGGRSLALIGHLDTVSGVNMTVEPFAATLVGNKIYGRGAVDMKGPVAAMVAVLCAFKRLGRSLKGDLYFAGVLAEETNSDGAETLVASGFRVDGAIVGEPSGRQYAIAHRGLEWLEVEISGKTAHGGIPEAGVNAIVNAAKFIMRVQDKVVPRLKERDHPYMGPAVMNFGRIEGGVQPSTVADRCIIRFDRRYTPAENSAGVIAEYEEVLAELRAEDPHFKGEIRRMESSLMKKYEHVPMQTDPAHPLVDSLRSSLELVTGEPPRPTTRRGWTDAAILNYYAGIPTVVYGPGDISRAHALEEYITADELVEGFKVFALTSASFCRMA